MTLLKDYNLNNSLIVNQNEDLVIYAPFNKTINDLNIIVEKDAHLKILFVNSKLNLKAALNKNAKMEIYNVFITNENAQININVDLNEEEAESKITNVYLGTNDSIIESNVYINHNNKLTNSDFMTYAISKDNAKLILNNNAHILNGMHQSNAYQKTKGLNLSSNAKIITQPNLFIDEYDVKASHSVAIGSINQDDLFYLMSRGLPIVEASKLIVMGFISPIISNIEDEETKNNIYNQFINNL